MWKGYEMECPECGDVDYGVFDASDIGYTQFEGIEFRALIDSEEEPMVEITEDSTNALSVLNDFEQRDIMIAAQDHASITEFFQCPHCYSMIENEYKL